MGPSCGRAVCQSFPVVARGGSFVDGVECAQIVRFSQSFFGKLVHVWLWWRTLVARTHAAAASDRVVRRALVMMHDSPGPRRSARALRRLNSSAADPRCPQRRVLHPRCVIATFGSDGAGRRIEASLTCIASAHDLGLQYVHMPILKLEHHTQASHANRVLGLGRLSSRSCWPTAHATRAAPNCGKCPPAAVEPSSYKLSPFKSELVGKEDCARAPPGTDWLTDFHHNPSLCARDGHNLHVGYHCFGYFWCTVVRKHAARSWYAVLPPIRAAYWDAASHELSGLVPPLERGTHILNVGLHHRTVKRRRFSNLVYHSLLDAVRARHASFLASSTRSASGGGSAIIPRVSLRIHVHSDHTFDPDPVNDEERAQRRAKPGLLLTLACEEAGDPGAVLTMHCKRRAGLSVYTPKEVTDPLASMHHLAQMDLLILSESSFSAVPALLGNMTVLLPMCHGPQIFTSRSPLPHWVSVPCTGNASEISSIIDQLPWPPPRNHWP